MPFDLSPPPKLWLPPKPAIVRALSREQPQLGFIPGFLPPGAAAAGARLTTLTQVGSATDTDANGSITSSVTIQAGDLLVIWGDATGPSSTASFPPGFSSALTIENTSSSKRGLYYKIAAGNEGTSVTGFSATGGLPSASNMLYVFRGNVPISSVTVAAATTAVTDANPTPQVVPSAAGTPPLIVLGQYSGAAVNPRTMSPAKDGEINVAGTLATDVWLAYKIYNSAPADVTVDMDDEGTGNRISSMYLACA